MAMIAYRWTEETDTHYTDLNTDTWCFVQYLEGESAGMENTTLWGQIDDGDGTDHNFSNIYDFDIPADNPGGV